MKKRTRRRTGEEKEEAEKTIKTGDVIGRRKYEYEKRGRRMTRRR
jgi:hypothetical protein